ncbi:response regulator [Paenibacillaceae bacterium WGS1546]|uniref:response regulator transcription factor n=1 Tax=Cohnella sp. WGS1546 TaxID=3366810 RepID=UPI00372D63E9
MIKVLIVDDDRLVRKGLISAMPWSDFGMEVVGEASNGEKALEFMEAHPVDLLVTDLAMSVMSGIELMREVRKRYAKLPIIVLTLHQDFEYVQEALRLGAIDYIAKVQLEKERFEEVLGRIRQRLDQEWRHVTAADTKTDEPLAVHEMYAVLCASEAMEDIRWLESAVKLAGGQWEEIDRSIGLWTPPANGDLDAGLRLLDEAVESRKGWAVMQLDGVFAFSAGDLHRWLRQYAKRMFFYDYRRGMRRHRISAEALAALANEPADGRPMDEIEAEWLTLLWLHDGETFKRLTNEWVAVRPEPHKLLRLLYKIEGEWKRIYVPVGADRIEWSEPPGSWEEACRVLETMRIAAARATGTHISAEVAGSIMAAVKIAKDEMDRPVYAVDVAKRVNMSRSYFNQMFKEMIGYSFNEYVQFVRIERAKQLLTRTSRPILWVAERTGYMDEKYFSRLFREQVGVPPSEYRKQQAQGGVLTEQLDDE